MTGNLAVLDPASSAGRSVAETRLDMMPRSGFRDGVDRVDQPEALSPLGGGLLRELHYWLLVEGMAKRSAGSARSTAMPNVSAAPWHSCGATTCGQFALSSLPLSRE